MLSPLIGAAEITRLMVATAPTAAAYYGRPVNSLHFAASDKGRDGLDALHSVAEEKQFQRIAP